jgi:hypothetical protein
MGILIGMDEAGYGPNYGPLVVAATAWEVVEEQGTSGEEQAPRRDARVQHSENCGVATGSTVKNPTSKIGAVDLYQLLRSIVAKSASERRIAIADSKVLYRPGLGLRQLERGVHAVLAAIDQSPTSWSMLTDGTNADPCGRRHHLCWHDGYDHALPLDATPDELTRLAKRFVRSCNGAGVRPIGVYARYIFPAEFNELVERYQSKGAALSHVTVGLLREVMDATHAEIVLDGATGSGDNAAFAPPSTLDSRRSTFVLCDKHGGRNYYTALLQHHFAEHWVTPTYESHFESCYEWGQEDSRVCVVFRMQGERFLPTALASMMAKYLRELAMRPFNEFWCARVPGLRPTAGYPTDSRRFRKAIAAAQRELAIDDHIVWRRR